MMGSHSDGVVQLAKAGMDVASVSLLISVLLSHLPAIAAVLTICWTAFRLYDTWLSICIKRRELKGDDHDEPLPRP